MSLINFNNEQKLIQNEVNKFARAELEPFSSELDKTGLFPTEIIKKLSDLGLSSVIIPQKYGGAGLDTTSLCIVLEELSKVNASIGFILVVNNCLVAYPLLHNASEKMQDHYLKKLVRGEIGGYGLDLEIDTPEQVMEKTEEGGQRVISGKLDFALNGESAAFFILHVLQDKNMTLCVVDDGAGLQRKKHVLLGLRTAGITGIDFKDVTLPQDGVILSGENVAAELQQLTDYAHIGFSAVSLGVAEAAFDASVKYAKERKQFGRAICEFAMVQEMLVEMKMRVEAARLLLYDAACLHDNTKEYSLTARMARLQSSDAAVFCGIRAIQIHGGYGYIKDYPIERYLRDAKVLQVLNQCPHDLKSHIAKELLV
jgi:butyryl-CoA dehydrogenase